jgi:hypothetical protein
MLHALWPNPSIPTSNIIFELTQLLQNHTIKFRDRFSFKYQLWAETSSLFPRNGQSPFHLNWPSLSFCLFFFALHGPVQLELYAIISAQSAF